MRYLIIILVFSFIQIKAQDQIIFLSGNEYYVDEITDIQNDSITYSIYKKTKKVPFSEVKGYYITIETQENLKKGYYKREREYHKVDTIHHIAYYNKIEEKKNSDLDLYIQSCINVDFKSLNYLDGFYITYDFDTVFCKISSFDDSIQNYAVFIAKIDSNKYKIFTPQQARGYSLKNIFYLSYHTGMEEDENIYMFITQEISGRINLYKKPNLPFHDGEYYLLNKVGSDDFHFICPYDDCYKSDAKRFKPYLVSSGIPSGPSFVYVPLNPNLDNSFEELMPQIVFECEKLANRIRSEFYTKRDFILIITEYNKDCK